MSTAKTIFIALPFAAFAFAEAWTAEPIHFVKRSWDDASKKVVETDTAITEYTVLSGNFEKKKDTVKADTWYVVKGTVTRLSVFAPPGASGNLVICDGATLKGQIAINEGSTLNIYGQEHDSGKIQAESVELVTAPENLGGAMESPVDGVVDDNSVQEPLAVEQQAVVGASTGVTGPSLVYLPQERDDIVRKEIDKDSRSPVGIKDRYRPAKVLSVKGIYP